MAANYDRTARFYDPLSYVVFGKTQVNAQNHFLHLIRPNSRVLIVGGGTGQILEALTQLHPSGLQITYVELSAGMINLAKQRAWGGNQVEFVTADIAQFNTHQPYNAVITSFLFDNFSEPTLQNIFAHIHAQLAPGALWLDTDFQLTGALWQKLLLKTMYSFFKFFGAVDVAKLPDTTRLFKQYAYTLTDQKAFYGKFICTKAYYKQ